MLIIYATFVSAVKQPLTVINQWTVVSSFNTLLLLQDTQLAALIYLLTFVLLQPVSPVVCVFKVNLYCRVEIMLNGCIERIFSFINHQT